MKFMTFSNEYDFNFKKDKTDKFISLIFGFMIYCMSVAFISGLFTYNLTNNWETSLKGQLTIEFPANADGTYSPLTEKQSEEVTNLLYSIPGVHNVKRIKEADILRILEPWIDNTAIPDDFPFPSLFDVEMDKSANIDLLDLTSKLSRISQGARIHNHANWYGSIEKISRSLFGFAMMISLLILLTVGMTIIYITKKTLSNHREIVKILQLIGASNKYIADQIKKYYFTIGLQGSGIAILLSLLTITGMSYLTSSQLLSSASVKYLVIGMIVPAIIDAIIMVTSQKTVLYFLKKEAWID